LPEKAVTDIVFTQMAAFALGYAAILVVPGPNVIAVGALAALRGARAALPMAIGAALGAMVLAAITSSAIRVMVAPKESLKIVGAGLLVLVAWRIVRLKPGSPLGQREPRAPPVEFASGFCTALTNPITAVYFAGALAGSSPADSIHVTGAIVASVPVISAAFYIGTLTLLSSPVIRRIALQWHAKIRLGGGLVLTFLAAWIMRG
jgi:threonine/homoserine/homoserine lactone efflux protein